MPDTLTLTERLTIAKQNLSRAAQDCLSGKSGAAEKADDAQAEVTALQAMLKAAMSKTLEFQPQHKRRPQP